MKSLFSALKKEPPYHHEEHGILSFKSGAIRFSAGDICYLHDYHPWHGGKNPLFDNASSRILDVKRGKLPAIKHYEEILVGLIYTKVSLFVVPSSDPAKLDTGIRSIIKRLVARGHWTDQNYNLYRTRKIDKYASGGCRDYQTQFDSLGLRAPQSVEGKLALILDDVTTSGTSLDACRQKLLNAGAARVYCLALAKTV